MEKKDTDNEMVLTVRALGVNEAFTRSAVAAFSVPLNPKMDEINDIKTAVSEAVTNCVVHGYEGKGEGEITIACAIRGKTLHITISDNGVGISDVERARQPFFTTKPEQERSGMGFTVMEAFMNKISVTSAVGEGTTVKMEKVIA
jgi:stage II sporulation protein AB (anti-sigma F factor)